MTCKDSSLSELSQQWINTATANDYAFDFSWLGRPIIQMTPDLYAIQELVWLCRPELIIETGIAHGGSLILSASMLALLDYCDAVENDTCLNPKDSRRKVLGIDIDIRSHNRTAIESHPMAHKIEMIEGSSIASEVIEQVKKIASGYDKIMVLLDSNHTHDHVLAELESYAPLVTIGSYCVVSDTGVEDLPENFYADRPWGKGNNPKTAVWEYLKTSTNFEIDKNLEQKLMITGAPDGYLKKVG